MKVAKIIHIEPDIWQKMPEGQRSELIRKWCREYVNAEEGDIDDINIELLTIQVINLRNKLASIQTELLSKETQLKRIKEKQQKLQEEKIKKEKEEAEKKKKCVICGDIHEENYKWHIFTKGNVCNQCFLSAESSQIKKWSEEE